MESLLFAFDLGLTIAEYLLTVIGIVGIIAGLATALSGGWS